MEKNLLPRRITGLFLCTALALTLFAGCGGNSTDSAHSSADASTVSSAAEVASTQAAASSGTSSTASGAAASSDAQSNSTISAQDADKVSLPICDETTTISYWFEMSPMVAGYLNTMNDNITYQYLEELTNVHVDFRAVSDETAQNFNLMVASGDWADIMVWGANYYSGGSIKAVEDGVFMELTDVIQDYMPNYASLIDDKDVYPQVIMNDGNIGEIFPINWGISVPGVGPIVRKDWLDDLGIDPASIETYDDYHTMLTRFKNEKGASQALYLGPYGVPTGNYLAAGYGIAAYCDPASDTGPYYQEDGTIKFGLIQPEFKDYLSMIHTWYEEGLISSDYISHSDVQISAGDVTDGSTGLWYHMSQIMSEHLSQASDPNFDSCAIQDAVKNPGDKTQLGNYSDSRVERNSLSISGSCENIEVVAKWIDFAFSDQGSMIYSYGIEGETYTLDADGTPHFTALITDNPDGLGMITACNLYAIQTGVGYLDQTRFQSGFSEAALEAGDIWMKALDIDHLKIIPSAAKMSTEDSQTYAAHYANIATYAAENIAKFITGARDLSEFDTFTADIEAMNIEECIACWQHAMDTYLAQE